MAEDVISPETECECWDVDDGDIPNDIHEKTVQSLLLKNDEILKKDSEDTWETHLLTADFDRSTDITDANTTPAKSDSNITEHSSDYSIVSTNPKKLYVTNISYRTSQRKMWEFFTGYGQVKYCQLLKDHNGQSKGRGFVTFKDVATAELVLNLGADALYLDGRNLEVKPATYKKFNQTDKRQSDSLKDQKSTIETENSICLINALGDDVMLDIFSYLTLKELLLCEMVCRRWRNLCIRQLQLRKHLSFEFLKTRFITGFKEIYFDNLVRSVSPAVQSIDLSMMHMYLGNSAVKTIAHYCPHLLSLDVSGLMITNPVLQELANNCPHLQTVKLNKCCKISDKGLWPLFTKCHELKELDADENGLLTGKSFCVAGYKLQKLSLARCTKLQDFALSHLLSRCKQLKTINLSYCTQLSANGVAVISQFHQLEVLYLLGSHCPVTRLELRYLENLRELHLAGNHTVTEEFLSLIGTFCQNLRFLDISDTNIRLDRVSNLCLCTKLQTLRANNLFVNKIGYDLIMEGSILRVVHLSGCQGLTEADILHIISVAQKLEELDIRHTDLSPAAAMKMFASLHKSDPERRITLLADDDSDEPFIHHHDEDDGGMSEAQSYLDGDDPLFVENFELS